MGNFQRNVYLTNIELEEAVNTYISNFDITLKGIKSKKIKVINSLGAVTINPVFARISSPFFNASAMDGICIKSIDTIGVDERNAKNLKLNKDFEFVDTGDVIKEPFDSVIMIEDVIEIDKETIKITKSASPWQNIRPVGEDIVAGELIIPAYHKIRPMDIGALLAGGITEIEVIQKPRIGIIPTGTEIIDAEEEITEGKIIDSNSRMFEAMVQDYDGIPMRYKPVIDDQQLIKTKIIEAINENDIVIIGAGSSAGTEDYTSTIIEELGEVIIHGVAIKPGKPAILGKINNKPIIGIPGYPVSAYIVFESFVKPIIHKYLHIDIHSKVKIEAILSKRVVSSFKHLEFIRVKLGSVRNKIIATPLSRGAGVTMSLVNADGILKVNKNLEGIESGELVNVELLRPIEEINSTIVSIGSHDVLLDILNNILHKSKTHVKMASTHVGSLGGIMSFKKGECHIAPIHLLDQDSGQYNVSYVKRYIKNTKTCLIKGVKRQQGLIVKKGNPKNIKNLTDLLRDDIVFVNRQKGSGTRVLLDYKLKEEKIDSEEINGYDREMTTHMMVASAVLSGTADAGMGVKSAANIMNLDFIPIGDEEYDFLVEENMLEDSRIKTFIHSLKSKDFEVALNNLGGYSIDKIGQIIRV